MDGVAGLRQDPIRPGESFDHDFVVPDAGTYWYQSHNRSFEQFAGGLHGAPIVEEFDAIDIDHEEALILYDRLINPETAQIADTFGRMHDLSHAGRLGNYITINGTYNLVRNVKRHDRLQTRLINAAKARLFQLGLDGLDGWTVTLDGVPFVQQRPVNDVFVLAPAQRIDLIVDVTADFGSAGHLLQFDRNEIFSQMAFEMTGQGTHTRRRAP